VANPPKSPACRILLKPLSAHSMPLALQRLTMSLFKLQRFTLPVASRQFLNEFSMLFVFKNMALQENLWVNSGSGKSPSV
jgi:hypothetical protein